MLIALALLACKEDDTDTDVFDTGDFAATVCGMASESFGDTVCRHRLAEPVVLEGLALEDPAADALITTRWFHPERADSRLPGLFANSRVLPDDPAFFVDGFPDRFDPMDAAAFEALVTGPDREFSTGSIGAFIDPESGNELLGFTLVETTPLTVDEIADIWRDLRDRCDYAIPVFVPRGEQVARAADWQAPFPIASAPPVAYALYSPGIGFGTLGGFTEAELDDALAGATVGVADLVVVDDAPFSVSQPLGGLITERASPVLAPANLHAIAHGTPSCQVLDAREQLSAELAGASPVRFECGVDGFTVTSATQAEVDAHLAALRPAPIPVPEPDALETTILPVEDIPVGSLAERQVSRGRYGAQAVDLAVAEQTLGATGVFPGLAIPVAYYEDFLDRNTLVAEIDGDFTVVTFREALEAWGADSAFVNDPTVRASRLAGLSAAMEQGRVDPGLITALEPAISARFGGAGITVRMRSSGTADHVLGLAIDGSEAASSGCLADDLDGDLSGPSACEAGELLERTVERAIARVYASAWSVEAVEERLWYGVGLGSSGSAVLVVARSEGEQAEIRAFTVDPTGADGRVLVHAQAGEGSAVDVDIDVSAEVARLQLGPTGVEGIEREQASSEAELVLSDFDLETLGTRLADLAATHPYDLGMPVGATVQLDTEWEIDSDGLLQLRNLRMFLD